MLLKSIKLNNIRSYINQTIEFPSGSVLLSGDIGSGKSTILLAVEFALFGAKGKELSGASLLRNGKKEGSVELGFEIDEKNVVIKRVLKRAKDDVRQDAGYIVINNRKMDGTATELKSRVIELMGYPKELVSKSKDLVYRYTVYTPQEQMKAILFEDKEMRLDALRRVFGIDKYKRIRENTQIYLREIKEKKREFEGKISDLEEKKRQKIEREHEIKEINIKIDELKPKLKQIKEKVNEVSTLIAKTEKSINELNKLKQELRFSDSELRNKVEQRQQNVRELKKIDESINSLEKEIGKKDIKNTQEILKELKDKENELVLMEKTFFEINKKIIEFDSSKKHSESIKEKILKIDKCPMCLQDVGVGHKNSINDKEKERIKELDEHLRLHKEQKVGAEAKIKEIKEKIEQVKKIERETELILLKKQNLDEKIKTKEDLINQQEVLKKDIGKINSRKMDINGKIDLLKDIEKEYLEIKKNFDMIKGEERKIEIEKTSFERDAVNVKKIIDMIDKDIKDKEEVRIRLKKMNEMHNWLDNYFLNLMIVMEKHVMLKIYNEFNELFKEWFGVLIEDETVNVRLDDEFTPIIEQNGYETDLANLSGGEKTSCALAYRLALNKVINDFIGDIKTKDLLILDEPTDGFSTEQLDKVRVILEQLNTKQVVIVSHESKIESFVDKVIRINKEEHVSEVLS